jgi:CubicO group peptidase (beta-lactamase class C family)
MKKKIGIAAILLVGLALVLLSFIGITPLYLYYAPSVAAGIGAKLACSSRFISKLSDEQALQDIIDYSPILAYLDVHVDSAAGSVSTSFLGLASATASYREGLGCALDYEGYTAREGIEPPQFPASAAEWPEGNRVETIEPTAQLALERLLEEDRQEGLETRALVAVRDQKIIAEAYGEGIGPDTQLLGWSMGKSINAVFIGHLVYEGKLSLDESGLFAEWSGDVRSRIRLVDLLNMTDGLDFSEVYQPGNDVTTMLFTEPDMARFVIEQPSAHPPGTHFSYSSGTANLLSLLVQRHTGGSLQKSLDYLAKEIYQPMGITQALFETDAAGVFVGSSYFYASARDWARAGQLLLNGGVLNGHRILGEEFVDRLSQPNRSANEPRYGFQFWLNSGGGKPRWPDLPADTIAAQGNREQRVMIIPSLQVVIVRLGWTKGRYPTNRKFAELISRL